MAKKRDHPLGIFGELSTKKLEEQPLVIFGGLIFMVVLSLVMISNNPTSDKYISTVISATTVLVLALAYPT
jgi:hypothetical protein